jgi:hypothetical protein
MLSVQLSEAEKASVNKVSDQGYVIRVGYGHTIRPAAILQVSIIQDQIGCWVSRPSDLLFSEAAISAAFHFDQHIISDHFVLFFMVLFLDRHCFGSHF